jgi:hypothetical protein
MAAAGDQPHQVALRDAKATGGFGVDLHERLRLGMAELGDAPGLGAGLIVGEHAAGGEEIGIAGVGQLGRRSVLDRVKTRAAVLGREALLEGAGSARIAFAHARPEHAVLSHDALVANAGVVGGGAGRDSPKLLEGGVRVGGKVLPAAQPVAECLKNLQIGPHPIRRRLHAAAVEHPAFEIGHGAFLLRPLRDRQHHVGTGGGLG